SANLVVCRPGRAPAGHRSPSGAGRPRAAAGRSARGGAPHRLEGRCRRGRCGTGAARFFCFGDRDMIGSTLGLMVVILGLSIPVGVGLGVLGLVLGWMYSPLPLTVALGELTWATS